MQIIFTHFLHTRFVFIYSVLGIMSLYLVYQRIQTECQGFIFFLSFFRLPWYSTFWFTLVGKGFVNMHREIVLSTQRFLRLVASRMSRGVAPCFAFYWRRRSLNGFKCVKDKDPVLFSLIVEDHTEETTKFFELYSVVCSLASSRKIAVKLRDAYGIYEELPF